MKNIFVLLLLATTAFAFACTDDNGDDPGAELILKFVTNTLQTTSQPDNPYYVAFRNNTGKVASVTVDADWLDYDLDDNELKFVIGNNSSTKERVAEVTITVDDISDKLRIVQSALTITYKTISISGASVGHVSPTGKYAVGTRTTWEVAYIWDIENDELELHYFDEFDCNVVFAFVTDEKLILGGWRGLPAYFQDGQWTHLDMTSLGFFQGQQYMTEVYSGASFATEDLSVIVGTLYQDRDGVYNHPLIWRNFGAAEILEVEAYHPNGFLAENGYFASRVSSDGRIVLGGETLNNQNHGLLWVDGIFSRYTLPHTQLAQNKLSPDSFLPGDAMSHNGRYVAGRYVDYDEENFENPHVPYLYDVYTGKFTFLEQDKGLTPSAVTDDGIIYLYKQDKTNYFTSYVYADGKMKTMTEYYEDKYGYSVPSNGYVSAISADGRSVIGWTHNGDKCFSIRIE